VNQWITKSSLGWLLAAVLSTIAGAVDVISFLALGGLFSAHITGNLVVLAAHYVTRRFSPLGPLLAVPVFVVVLGLTTLVCSGRGKRETRRALLVLHALLLAGFLALGAGLGPFRDPQSAIAIFVGMVGVAAMATQNALVRIAFAGFPSTAVMTTNTTQLTIDVSRLLRGISEPADLTRTRARAYLTFPAVAGFVAGCASGAFLEVHYGLRALVLPVVLAVIAVPLGDWWGEACLRDDKPNQAE
jgi:uncharacterized membrane protein YoaK (UPF0700 family)